MLRGRLGSGHHPLPLALPYLAMGLRAVLAPLLVLSTWSAPVRARGPGAWAAVRRSPAPLLTSCAAPRSAPQLRIPMHARQIPRSQRHAYQRRIEKAHSDLRAGRSLRSGRNTFLQLASSADGSGDAEDLVAVGLNNIKDVRCAGPWAPSCR